MENKLYKMIDNNLSLMRKRILYNWYYENNDIKNILWFIDDFQKYVNQDCFLNELRFRFWKDIYKRKEYDIFYRDIIDWIDDILLKMYIIQYKTK
jgi:hypothetical protein